MSAGARRENPYVGLRPFDRDDSHLFFGRIEQLTELLERLYRARFLGVVGSSGCGKSSLIRAGLVPALLGGFLVEERDRWHVAALQPGGAPRRNLAAALTGTVADGCGAEEAERLSAEIEEGHAEALAGWLAARMGEAENLLLLVDQFEEIFAFRGPEPGARDGAPSPEERREASRRRAQAADFVDLLLALAVQRRAPVYVVLTMRSDYLGDCDVFAGLPEAMNAGRYLVPRLSRRQMQEAIEGPARLFGAAVHPRLTDRLLNESGTEADRLPLLEHTLMRVWDAWAAAGGEGPLRLEHYDRIGTLKHALSRHADEALAAVDRKVAERVFRRLTDTDPLGRSVREACRLSELVAVCGGEERREAVEAVLREFGARERTFLALHEEVPGDPRVVISHESLIRNWPTLREWVAEERLAKEGFQELVKRARARQERKASLLHGADLSLAQAWQKKAAPSAAWAERYRRAENDLPMVRSFLRWSALRRLLVIGAGVAVAALLVVLTVRATTLSRAARDEARILIAEKLVDVDPTHAGLVLGELERPGRRLEVLDTMHRVLGQPLAIAAVRHEGRVVSAAFSPDGKQVVTASTDGTARIWSADGRGRPEVLRGHRDAVMSAAFSPDGTQVLTASTDGTARLWSTGDGGRALVLAGHAKPVTWAAFSPAGDRVVTASSDATVRVWSSRDGVEVLRLLGHGEAVWRATYSPDGGRIVTASDDGTARVWDARTGEELLGLAGHEGLVGTATFDPAGTRILTASSDRTARVWDAGNGTGLSVLGGHDGPVFDAAFSPDGSRVATASLDGWARVWSLGTASAPVVLAGHEGAVRSVAFSPDGRRVVTASDDGTARVWSADRGRAIGTLSRHDREVVGAVFSADGGRIVTASWDGSARVWSAPGVSPPGALAEPAVLRGHERGVWNAAFAPDGRRIVTASLDGKARVWVADPSGRWPSRPDVVARHPQSVRSVAFSPDGRAFVSASHDGIARIWAADGSGVRATLEGHRRGVETASFSPDGRRVVTASQDGTARVWQVEGGIELERFDHPVAVVSAAFSPDGRRVVTAAGDNAVRVWPAAGGGEPVVHRALKAVAGAAFSPDGRRVLIAALYEGARIWSVGGSEESVLLEHPYPVESAAFSPDGHWVVTTSGSKIQISQLTGPVQEVVLGGHRKQVHSAVFSPDGRQVLTASSDGTARVWGLTPERLSAVIRSRTTVCLDPEFRRRHFGESARVALSRFQSCERTQGRAAP